MSRGENMITKIMFQRLPILILPLIVLIGGCVDLSVENLNEPDSDRALAEAEGVEAMFAGSFIEYWWTQKNYPFMALSVVGGELTSTFADFGIYDLGRIPREPYNNSPTYEFRGVNWWPWSDNYTVLSLIRDGLQSIELGVMDDPDDMTPVYRAQAFGKFMQGVAHGYLGLFFDKAYVLTEDTDLEVGLKFEPYSELQRIAVEKLEEAIELCNQYTFTISDNWIYGLTLTNNDLKRLAHSFIARYLASTARTPEERVAVPWDRVLYHTERGIEEDFAPEGDGGDWWWTGGWRGQRPTFARASYFTLGPADTSGDYEEWSNTPYQDRTPFLIHTADRRITGEDGPESPGIDFAYSGPAPFPPERGTYFFSHYVHTRYRYHIDSGAYGAMPHLTLAELNLLEAEALYRLGATGVNRERMVHLINSTRVERVQLPPATVDQSDEELFEMIKYEKKIETFNTFSGLQYFDRRGWGELVSGTLLHLPVPGQELEMLLQPIYTHGGDEGDTAAKRFFRNMR